MLNKLKSDLPNKKTASRLLPALFGLAGIFIVFYSTSKYGAGVSGDSLDYISTADNLIRYHRFFDYGNHPYILWPPLYPLLLAGLSLVSGYDTFLVGWVLNAISYGLIIYLAGILFGRAFPDGSIWQFFGLMVTLTSLPILRLAANITSDPLFIVLVLLFVIQGHRYLCKPQFSTLFSLAMLAALGPVLRVHGVTLVMTAVGLVLIANRKNLKLALLNSFWVGVLASTPFFIWMFGRNLRLYGTILGERDLTTINVPANFVDSVMKITHWVVPDQIIRYISPFVFLVGFVVFLVLSKRWSDMRALSSQLSSPLHLPWLIFVTIDYILVLITTFTQDHPANYDDRYYTPFFVFFFLFLTIVFTELVLKPLDNRIVPHQQKTTILGRFLILVVFIWLIYPSYRAYKYVIVSHTQGELTYNFYNSQEFHESDVIQFLGNNKLDQSKPVYSNFSGAVYFYTRNITLRAPHADQNRPDLEILEKNYQDWPPTDDAYLVWFWPNYWKFYFTPKQLSTIVNLTEIFSSKDGGIYLVSNP